ncbi:MAG: HlyD family secretion protein [Syntrophorhabdus aromaticivorans]|uniref:HlyD family secretion protein n=1 Tax=Syntrophorhabdus aromaticivorans TaxID=328301 RepID=A0A971M5B8_9BACT|nr:HlyD family secretion protein [Syntrophorhabdus aromaticivorans]
MEETGEVLNNGSNSRKKKLIIGGIIAAMLFVVFLFAYLRYRAGHITTDDAYVEGAVHTVASKVAGTVKNVLVADNQSVKKGDVLVEIDEVDYDIKVKEASTSLDAEKTRLFEARSRLDAARRQVDEVRAAISSAKAAVEVQEANARQARLDMKRADNLFKNEAISRERHEKAKTSLDVAEAQLKAAGEQVKRLEASLQAQLSAARQAEALVKTQQAMIVQRQTVVEAAELTRSYVKIVAPADGYVTKKSVEAGNQVSPGQPLLAVVPLGDTWIVANYKETQLQRIRPGQKVRIKIDALPNKKLTGIVESVMAGTGATFSLFPPENATGNYVKVVQRVPVKIVLDKDANKDHSLRIGMSVVPTVIVK